MFQSRSGATPGLWGGFWAQKQRTCRHIHISWAFGGSLAHLGFEIIRKQRACAQIRDSRLREHRACAQISFPGARNLRNSRQIRSSKIRKHRSCAQIRAHQVQNQSKTLTNLAPVHKSKPRGLENTAPVHKFDIPRIKTTQFSSNPEFPGLKPWHLCTGPSFEDTWLEVPRLDKTAPVHSRFPGQLAQNRQLKPIPKCWNWIF